MTRSLPAIVLMLVLPSVAHAQDDTEVDDGDAPPVLDAADVARLEAMVDAAIATHPHEFRWSDGPRNVPRPRGPSMERARRLGLGTQEAATILLTRAADPR